jgi:hypothetical protein
MKDEEIAKLIVNFLPEGNGAKFCNDYKIRNWTLKDLLQLNQSKELLHIVSLVQRTGAAYFFNYLEKTYFSPNTPANDEYHYVIFKWKKLLWAICSIPIEKENFAEESAKEAKMKLQKTVPFVAGQNNLLVVASCTQDKPIRELVENENIEWFPVNVNVRTLENESGSPIYQPGGKQDAEIEEKIRLQKLKNKTSPP